jgi:hypothetical protein
MTIEARTVLRLKFLTRVVRKECRHLATTDQRLFGSGFSLVQANQLEGTSKKQSHRRRPVSSSLIPLDSGFRRNDESEVFRGTPCYKAMKQSMTMGRYRYEVSRAEIGNPNTEAQTRVFD